MCSDSGVGVCDTCTEYAGASNRQLSSADEKHLMLHTTRVSCRNSTVTLNVTFGRNLARKLIDGVYGGPRTVSTFVMDGSLTHIFFSLGVHGLSVFVIFAVSTPISQTKHSARWLKRGS